MSERSLRPVGRLLRLAAGVAVVAGLMLAPTQASALTIIPHYGVMGAAPAFSQAAIDDINAAITLYQNTFTDNVTVNINIQNMTSGLGQSSTNFITTTFTNYYNALVADTHTADDTAALSVLTAASYPGSTSFLIRSSTARALGLTANFASDSTIGLNESLCFTSHNAPVGGQYDLFGVACHEIDEALGTSSGVGGTREATDAFRYAGPGDGTLTGRSFSNLTTVHTYFSIDGVNPLDEYNQFNRGNGTGNGDWGDWVRHTTPQVQDWQGTSGVTINPDVEFRLLDVIGWNRAPTPEPTTLAAFGVGLIALARRRKTRRQ